jgi:hypothetical protein
MEDQTPPAVSDFLRNGLVSFPRHTPQPSSLERDFGSLLRAEIICLRDGAALRAVVGRDPMIERRSAQRHFGSHDASDLQA